MRKGLSGMSGKSRKKGGHGDGLAGYAGNPRMLERLAELIAALAKIRRLLPLGEARLLGFHPPAEILSST